MSQIPTGWNPGKHPGETEVDAATRLVKEYPGTTAIRKFFDGALGPANEGALSVAKAGMRVIVSWLYSATMPNVVPFVDTLLAQGIDVDLCVAHEPEKKITPEQLLSANRIIEGQLRNHPQRSRIRIAACVTVQRARIYQPSDLERFFTSSLAEVIDVLAWDWYPSINYKGQIAEYEHPDTALELCSGYSASLGLPWAIYEINHERILESNGFAVDLDPDGTKCAQWMRQMYDRAILDGATVWTWFHKGGGDLTMPGTNLATGEPLRRDPEADALRQMIAGFQPDPNDPQYQAGYEAGWKQGNTQGYEGGYAVGMTDGRTQILDDLTEWTNQQHV